MKYRPESILPMPICRWWKLFQIRPAPELKLLASAPFFLQAVNMLLFKIDIDANLHQAADCLNAVHFVSDEPCQEFRDDHVNIPVLAVLHHP